MSQQRHLQKDQSAMSKGIGATKELVQEFEDVDKTVTRLKDDLARGWQGTAGAEFGRSVERWLSNFKKVRTSLDSIQESLEASDKKMNANEDQNLTYAKAAFNSGEHSSRVFNGIVA